MTTSGSFSAECICGQDPVGDLLFAPIMLVMALALATFQRSGFVNVDLEWQLIGITVAGWLVSKAVPISSFRTAVNALLQYVLIVFSATVLSYSAATIGRPLIDRELLLADQYLGYDWRTYAEFFANHPKFARVMKFSYTFIFFVPFIVTAASIATNNVRALEKFILAGLISLSLTVGIFALFPATTAWTHLQLSDAEVAAFQHLPLPSQDWIGKLIQIRQQGAANIRTLSGNGLIAFPSFHCAAALLLVWSTWSIRWLRGPIMMVSIALLAATPIFGGHYVSDMIAGAAIMLISVRATERLYAIMLDFKNAMRFRRSRSSQMSPGPSN